jgi:hypothetical protein
VDGGAYDVDEIHAITPLIVAFDFLRIENSPVNRRPGGGLLRFSAASEASKPEGRRPWMAAVFGPSQDGESENPRDASGGSFALIGEGPFFWFLFFTRTCGARPSGRLRRSRLRRSGPAKKRNPLARGERKLLTFVPEEHRSKSTPSP